MSTPINRTSQTSTQPPLSAEKETLQRELSPTELNVQNVAIPQLQSSEKPPSVIIKEKPANLDAPAHKRLRESSQFLGSHSNKTIEKPKAPPKGQDQKKRKLEDLTPSSKPPAEDSQPQSTTTTSNSLPPENRASSPKAAPNDKDKSENTAPTMKQKIPSSRPNSQIPSSSPKESPSLDPAQTRKPFSFSLNTSRNTRPLNRNASLSSIFASSSPEPETTTTTTTSTTTTTPTPTTTTTTTTTTPSTTQRTSTRPTFRVRTQSTPQAPLPRLNPKINFSGRWATQSRNVTTRKVQSNHDLSVSQEDVRRFVLCACNDQRGRRDPTLISLRDAIKEGKSLEVIKGLHEIKPGYMSRNEQVGHITVKIRGKDGRLEPGAYHINCSRIQDSEPPFHVSNWKYTHTTWSEGPVK